MQPLLVNWNISNSHISTHLLSLLFPVSLSTTVDFTRLGLATSMRWLHSSCVCSQYTCQLRWLDTHIVTGQEVIISWLFSSSKYWRMIQILKKWHPWESLKFCRMFEFHKDINDNYNHKSMALLYYLKIELTRKWWYRKALGSQERTSTQGDEGLVPKCLQSEMNTT